MPTTIPVEDLQSLDLYMRKIVVRFTARIFPCAKPPRSNLSLQEETALKKIQGQCYRSSGQQYRRKVEVLLDPANYNIIDHDTTLIRLKRTNQHIKRSSLAERPDQKPYYRGASEDPRTRCTSSHSAWINVYARFH